MKLFVLKKEINIFDVFFTLLAFTIPLSFALPNIFLVLAFLTFLLNRNKEKTNLYVKLVLLFAAFFILKALFNKELIENFFIYKHLIAFAVISILVFNISDLTLVKKGFVLGVLSAVIFTVSQIISYYLKNNSIPLGNTAEAGELLLIHRPYFGFICFLGTMCSTDLINTAKGLKEKLFYKVIITLFIVFVYLITARLAIGLVIIYLFITLLQRVNLSKKKLFLLIGVFIGLILLLVMNNRNLKKRLHIENTFEKTVKVISNQEPRVVIWNCFFEVIKKTDFNYFIGYNDAKNIQLVLNECYKSSIENVSKNKYFFKTKFNTHNQFFDFFLQGGLIGLTLFLLILGYSFYLCRFNFTSLFVLVGFILFLIAENLFHRQIGVYLIGVFIPLFLNTHTVKKLKK
jgi:O-antigen ligase